MLEFLDHLRREDTIPAGHHAIQFIRQWAAAAARAGRPASFEGLPPYQLELSKRIVAEIEAHEGKSVLAMSQSDIEDYIRLLAQKVLDLSSRDFPADAARGARLLENLRLEVR
jgi:hypothetical protein